MMILGFSLIIGTMFLPLALKNLIAIFVNMLMAPIASHVPFYVTLIGISLVTTACYTLVRRYKVDQNLLKLVTEKNQAIMKDLREAQLSGDKKALKRIDEERSLLLQDQSKVNIQQLKSSGHTALVTVPLWLWISWYLANQPAPLVMNFLILGNHALTDQFFIMPYWMLLFALISIPVGLIVRKAASKVLN